MRLSDSPASKIPLIKQRSCAERGSGGLFGRRAASAGSDAVCRAVVLRDVLGPGGAASTGGGVQRGWVRQAVMGVLRWRELPGVRANVDNSKEVHTGSDPS